LVAGDERLVGLSELDTAGDEGVLRGTVDEGHTLQDWRDGEERRVGYLVRHFDRIQEVVRGVVHAWRDIGITFSVGSPEDNDLLELVIGLKLAKLKVGLLVVAGKEFIRTLLLVSGDKSGVVDWRKEFNGSHERDKLVLQIPQEDLGTLYSCIEGNAWDVPSTDNEVVWVNGGEDRREWDVNILSCSGIDTGTKGGSMKDRSNVVGRLNAFLGAPGDVVEVAVNIYSAVVTADTNLEEKDLLDYYCGHVKGVRVSRIGWDPGDPEKERTQCALGHELECLWGGTDDMLITVVDNALAAMAECETLLEI
jgi:hypothetical protein